MAKNVTLPGIDRFLLELVKDRMSVDDAQIEEFRSDMKNANMTARDVYRYAVQKLPAWEDTLKSLEFILEGIQRGDI